MGNWKANLVVFILTPVLFAGLIFSVWWIVQGFIGLIRAPLSPKSRVRPAERAASPKIAGPSPRDRIDQVCATTPSNDEHEDSTVPSHATVKS